MVFFIKSEIFTRDVISDNVVKTNEISTKNETLGLHCTLGAYLCVLTDKNYIN